MGNSLMAPTTNTLQIPGLNNTSSWFEDLFKNFNQPNFDLQGMLNNQATASNVDLTTTDGLDTAKANLYNAQADSINNPSLGSQMAPWLSAFGTAEGMFSKYFGQGKDQFDEQMKSSQQNRKNARMAREDRTAFLGDTQSAFA